VIWYIDIEIVTSSLTSGIDVPRSTQIGILVIASRIVDDNDEGNNNNNNNIFNQFIIIYVLTQQQQGRGKLHRQHRKIRKIQI
jgi:hypothetical protein